MIQARSVAGLMMDHRRRLATLVNCEKDASLWHLWNLSPTTATKLTKHAVRVLEKDESPPRGLGPELAADMSAIRRHVGAPTCRRVSAVTPTPLLPKQTFAKQTSRRLRPAGRTGARRGWGGWGALGGLGGGGGGGEKDVMEAGNLLRVPGPHQHPNSPSRRHRCRRKRRHVGAADMSARHVGENAMSANMSAAPTCRRFRRHL